MERTPSGGEQWSGYRKQQLFQNLQTDLFGYGVKRPLSDEYTGMPTGTLVHTIEVSAALQAMWAETKLDLQEVVHEASLSYRPAHTDARRYPYTETIHLQIESGLRGGTVRILQEYRIARTQDAVLGTHKATVIPTNDAAFEGSGDIEEGRPQIMEAPQYLFLEDLLGELRYQREYDV